MLSLVSCPSRRSRMAILALPHMGPTWGQSPRTRWTAATGAGVHRERRGRRGRRDPGSARLAHRYNVARETPTAAAASAALKPWRLAGDGRHRVSSAVAGRRSAWGSSFTPMFDTNSAGDPQPSIERKQACLVSHSPELNHAKPGKEAVMALRRRPDGARVGAAASRRRILRAGHDAASRRKNRPGAPPLDPGGREVRTQEASSRYRASVRATRNPMTLPRPPVSSLKRTAERRSLG